MNSTPPSEVPFIMWVLVALILFTQSTVLFINARRHGHNPWLWGIIGLVHFPMATLLYLIFAKKIVTRFKGRK